MIEPNKRYVSSFTTRYSSEYPIYQSSSTVDLAKINCTKFVKTMDVFHRENEFINWKKLPTSKNTLIKVYSSKRVNYKNEKDGKYYELNQLGTVTNDSNSFTKYTLDNLPYRVEVSEHGGVESVKVIFTLKNIEDNSFYEEYVIFKNKSLSNLSSPKLSKYADGTFVYSKYEQGIAKKFKPN